MLSFLVVKVEFVNKKEEKLVDSELGVQLTQLQRDIADAIITSVNVFHLGGKVASLVLNIYKALAGVYISKVCEELRGLWAS